MQDQALTLIPCIKRAVAAHRKYKVVSAQVATTEKKASLHDQDESDLRSFLEQLSDSQDPSNELALLIDMFASTPEMVSEQASSTHDVLFKALQCSFCARYQAYVMR
jgi:hypothetical protein